MTSRGQKGFHRKKIFSPPARVHRGRRGRPPVLTGSAIQTQIIGPQGSPPRPFTDAFLDAEAMPIVYRCNRLLAEQAAGVPQTMHYCPSRSASYRRGVIRELEQTEGGHKRLSVIRTMVDDGDLKEVVDHPLLSALYRGGEVLTGRQTRLTLFSIHGLTGEVPLVAGRKYGVPHELTPVPSTWLHETPSATKAAYTFRYMQWQKEIPKRDVFMFRTPTTTNPLIERGSSGVRALAQELELASMSRDHIFRFFLGGGIPTHLISGEGLDSRDESGQQVLGAWNQSQAQARPFNPVLYPRELNVTKLGSSFADLQVDKLRESQRDVILQTLGIPPEIMGVLGKSNRSTIDLAQLIFIIFTLIPLLEHWRDFVQYRVLPVYPLSEGIWFDYRLPVREEEEQVLKRFRVGSQVMRVNDALELYGKKPDPEHGNMWIVRDGYRVVGSLADLIEPPANQGLSEAAA